MDEESDLEALARRLRRVEDELGIARLLARCAHAVDYGDERVSLGGFTTDATWEGRHVVSGKTFIQHQGTTELAGFFAGHTRAPHLYHKHVVADLDVDVRGDEATATSYVLFLVSGPGGIPTVGGFGRYRDQLRRCDDGQWRIGSRLAEVEAWNPLYDELSRNRRHLHRTDS
jgi:ketosteroid isomerase-like protein